MSRLNSRRRRPGGFTILELAICLTILAIVTPSLYLMARSFEAQHRKVLADADAAAGLRSFSEELRRDRFSTRLADEPGLVLIGDGRCPRLTYAVDAAGNLRRSGAEGCGPERVVARGVERLERRAGLVTLVFARRVDAAEVHRTTLLVGLAGEGAP